LLPLRRLGTGRDLRVGLASALIRRGESRRRRLTKGRVEVAGCGAGGEMRLFSLAGEDQDSPGLGPRSLNDDDEAKAAEFSQGRGGGTGSVGESSALDPVPAAPKHSPVWLRRPKGKRFILRRRRGKEREAPSRREQTRGKRQREESRRTRGKLRFSFRVVLSSLCTKASTNSFPPASGRWSPASGA
jgi:hypothetical protein